MFFRGRIINCIAVPAWGYSQLLLNFASTQITVLCGGAFQDPYFVDDGFSASFGYVASKFDFSFASMRAPVGLAHGCELDRFLYL